MALDEDIRRYVLGEVLVDELPAIAVQALEAGYDSLFLRQLAGAQGCDPQEARTLFTRAIKELKIPMPSAAEAALAAARIIAQEVVNGKVAPYDGARRIWFKLYTRFPEIQQFVPFVGLASEYEDDEEHRAEYASRILKECKKLLGET